eukprot:659993-Alexandrium_andersonii.AAC.1
MSIQWRQRFSKRAEHPNSLKRPAILNTRVGTVSSSLNAPLSPMGAMLERSPSIALTIFPNLPGATD